MAAVKNAHGAEFLNIIIAMVDFQVGVTESMFEGNWGSGLLY